MNLVLFDLDHTLLNGTSENEWGGYLIDKGILDSETYRAKRLLFYQDYCAGKMDIEELLQFQLAFLTLYPTEQLHIWREEYIEKRIRPLITQEAWKRIDHHKTEGAELVLITATHEFLTAPIAELLGIKHLLAPKVERTTEGGYTGRSFGTHPYREGKVTCLQEWLATQGRSLKDYKETWFYSDSHNDLPLLSLVTHPVAVNPDKKLLEHAQLDGWSVVDFGIISR